RVCRGGRVLPGRGLRRLLLPRRPGGAPRAPERAPHNARVRLARPAGRDPGLEGAHGLGDALVHPHRRLRRGFRRRRVAWPQRVRARRRPDLPHLLHRRPRRRGARQHLELPRHDRARAPGGVGGLARGLPAVASLQIVALPRRLRRAGMTMTPRVLLDGLAIPESPRWYDGRLWFSNWGTRQIVAVDLDGSSENTI